MDAHFSAFFLSLLRQALALWYCLRPFPHGSSFLEHLTPDVGHNIVIFDYKVNYDHVFFWLLQHETRSRTARDSRRRRLFPGYVKASHALLYCQHDSQMHVVGRVFGMALVGGIDKTFSAQLS